MAIIGNKQTSLHVVGRNSVCNASLKLCSYNCVVMQFSGRLWYRIELIDFLFQLNVLSLTKN